MGHGGAEGTSLAGIGETFALRFVFIGVDEVVEVFVLFGFARGGEGDGFSGPESWSLDAE